MKPSLIINISIFFTGFAGIVAEYSISTIATYLLGNAVFQWSVIISLFLLFMGLGSHLSRYIPDKYLINAFIFAELLLSICVSTSPLIAYSFAYDFMKLQTVIYILSGIIGTLIGLEIPIAVRINNLYEELKVNISAILEKDYLGAVPAGLFYAYFFLPKLGLIYTTLLAGFLNLITAILFAFFLCRSKLLKIIPPVVAIFLILYGIFAKDLILYQEQKLYGEKIIYLEITPYQKIILTQYRNNYSLYLDGHLQFSTLDEVRYHETLVHIPAGFLKNFKRALILGGGDGLALREVKKYPFEEIILVDLDKKMIEFSTYHPVMRKLNGDSFKDTRVKTISEDAFNFVFSETKKYDLVIIDLVDPRTPSSARVYSLEFYRKLKSLLAKDGVFITQAGDVFFKRKVFCSILKTIKSAGFKVVPLVVNIPTMGEWGFIIGSESRLDFENLKLLPNLKFLNKDIALSAYLLGKSVKCRDEEINTILKPVILHYYYSSAYY